MGQKQQSTNKIPNDNIQLMAARIQRTKKEMDKSLRSLDFSLGKPISKGIPWNKFSEIEVQAILKLHFETLGFNVIWRHKQDPANEEGIDLECYRKSDNKKVTVAVKIKPLKKDIAQVLELAESRADQRIYVYINGAAQSFRDLIKKYGSDIEFWDRKKLEENLNESNLTLKLKIDNSYSAYAIHDITNKLEDTINRKPEKGFPKPKTEIMRMLWGMKDRAVSVNKCARMAQSMFEDPKKFGKMNQIQILNFVLWCLDHMSSSLDSLSDGFKSRSSDLEAIIYYTYEGTRVRSNWLNLKMYSPGLIPGNVESIAEYTPVISTFKDTEREGEKLDESEVSDLELLYFEEAAGEFCHIAIWAGALEDTIDSFYEECINELFKQ